MVSHNPSSFDRVSRAIESNFSSMEDRSNATVLDVLLLAVGGVCADFQTGVRGTVKPVTSEVRLAFVTSYLDSKLGVSRIMDGPSSLCEDCLIAGDLAGGSSPLRDSLEELLLAQFVVGFS